jgi:hypothetical protein
VTARLTTAAGKRGFSRQPSGAITRTGRYIPSLLARVGSSAQRTAYAVIAYV